MGRQSAESKLRPMGPSRAEARCACGKVVVEIAVPAQWAWHDHSAATRRFCASCGTPMLYERSAQHVNIPRALFTSGVGREPRYHIAIDELQEWTYLGEKLGPLKGFPGVVWNKGRRK